MALTPALLQLIQALAEQAAREDYPAAPPAAAIPAPLPERSCFVYRFFDEAGSLLYVGSTFYPRDRLSDHKRHSPWFPLAFRWECEEYVNEQSARLMEYVAIVNEHPRFNVKCMPIEQQRQRRGMSRAEILNG